MKIIVILNILLFIPSQLLADLIFDPSSRGYATKHYKCDLAKTIHVKHNTATKDLKRNMYSLFILETDNPKVKNQYTLYKCFYKKPTNKKRCEDIPISKVSLLDGSQIKKYYNLDMQYDLQVFKDLSFIENNGKGVISVGMCKILDKHRPF